MIFKAYIFTVPDALRAVKTAGRQYRKEKREKIKKINYIYPALIQHNHTMAIHLTEKKILKLAPDEASVKAGKGLAVSAKWVLRQYSERALWGHCQGSGSTPYQTQIDLHDLAFECSCPSRKFPCKHELGLLLLYANRPDDFTQAEEPGWVSAWLAKRQEKAEKKEAREKQKTEAPVDEAAQAKRLAARHKKVAGGVDDLQTWLKDLLRTGLLNVPDRAYALFDGIAKRMVDAQAPGLAAQVRSLQEIDYYSDTWKYELTDRLAKLYLLAESYKHLDRQPAEWQQEIKSLIGFSRSKEEILSGESVTDDWLVLASESREQDRLTAWYYWLYGKTCNRYALLMEFVAPGNLPEYNLVPGTAVTAEVCFYPGILPLRVLFKQYRLAESPFVPPFLPGIRAAADCYRKALQTDPFLYEVPLLVSSLRLVPEGNGWLVTDAEGNGMPVLLNEASRIQLLAICGGSTFSAFVSAGVRSWRLRAIWHLTDFHLLDHESD